MTQPTLPALTPAEVAAVAPTDPEAGLGAIRTPSGNLPLEALEVRAQLVGLTSQVTLTQRFHNPHPEPVQATYVFPLPDRGAVTGLRMTAGDRTVRASLAERSSAREQYDAAIAEGRRAAIAEEERPDVFTMRVGNILPGEQVAVELTVVGVLPVADGEATFRFPLVVAPRYLPGRPLPADAVGDGVAPDTDAVPDASRISPPVLLPGFPNPVQLDIVIDVDPAGLVIGPARSSLHAVQVDGTRIQVQPGARADRDLVVRIPVGQRDQPSAALTLVPDPVASEPGEADGTFEVTVLPPDLSVAGRPRDVVLLLDRSGSMAGWKMVAARRAAARIVDTLTEHDTFAVLAFDHVIETPSSLPAGLLPGTDRNRFRAIEFLAGLVARGGTELGEPLARAAELLADRASPRDRVLVLVTDGQVGNEDQLLRAHAETLEGLRLHAVGIDQAVNAGFLGRLASLGGGRCELVESEDRLDEAMAQIHRRICAPLVTGIELSTAGIELEPGSSTPARVPDLFPGVPFVLRGRYWAGQDEASIVLRGTTPSGDGWSATAVGVRRTGPSVTAAWARGRLRDLEDRYVVDADRFVGLGEPVDTDQLERRIVALSLRFGVLCRFTAFVAVDERVVTDGTRPRTILQPVEPVSGWQPTAPPAPPATLMSGRPGRARSAPPPAGPAPMAPVTALAAPAPWMGLTGFVSAPGGGSGSGSDSATGGTGGDLAGDLAGDVEADRRLLCRLLATEATRLREQQTAAEHHRREALLDLGSRLAVFPARDDPDARWHQLIELLRPERVAGDPLEPLWQYVLRLLDELSQEPTSSGGHDGPGPSAKSSAPAGPAGPTAWSQPAPRGTKRPAFWKHYPDR